MATYAALRLYVDSWRWEGVPFYVRAGKCLEMTVTEVIVELKQPAAGGVHGARAVGGQLRPLPPEPRGRDRARRARQAARRGHGRPAGRAVGRGAGRSKGRTGRMGDYERLLGDAMAGDATLFARQDVVEAAWAIVDPGDPRPEPDVRVRAGHLGPAAGRRARGRRGRLEHTAMKDPRHRRRRHQHQDQLGGRKEPLKIPSGAEMTRGPDGGRREEGDRGVEVRRGLHRLPRARGQRPAGAGAGQPRRAAGCASTTRRPSASRCG